MTDDRYDKVTFRGRTVDKYSRASLLAVEKELGYELTIVQGSYNKGGVAASAGTHDGGGCIDLLAWDAANKVKALRRNGWVADKRLKSQGFSGDHIHAVQIGNTKASPAAKAQIAPMERGEAGLARRAPQVIKYTPPGGYKAFAYPAAAPKPAASTALGECLIRTLTINVGADYVPNYSSRLDEIEAVRNAARASLVFTTESGNYDDGARLNRQFGWGGKRNGTVTTGESFVLHGDSVPITTAVHFDPAKYDVLDEGLWDSGLGTHRWATWTLLRHRSSGVIFIAVVTHLQYLPKGPNNVKQYDEERNRQLDAVFAKTKALQVKVLADRTELEVVPALVNGDTNSKHSDPYDASVGVSKAVKDAGFLDAGSTDIDRSFYIDAECVEKAMLPTKGATDHPTAFAAAFRLSNRKATP